MGDNAFFSEIKHALLFSIGRAPFGLQCKRSRINSHAERVFFSEINMLYCYNYMIALNFFFQLKMWYNHKSFELIVTIICSVGLPLSDQGKFRNPYCKLYLLPDRR